MFTLVLLCVAIFIPLFGLFNILIWDKINYSWLEWIASAIVISFPFERIPSLALGGSNIRIGQILVLLGVWFLLVLLYKRDKKLLATKTHPLSWLFGLFIIVSIPSWFMVQDDKRFWVTEIATWLCFTGSLLIIHFTRDVWVQIKRLVWVMMGVNFFAVYQFVGDLIGIPYEFTGLREHYTQRVFGFPRVHATALEPLYFAGMLFLPIIACFVAWLAHKNIIKSRFGEALNFGLFTFFTIIFVLTISKGAYLALGLTMIVLLVVWAIRNPAFEMIKNLTYLVITVAIVGTLGITFSPKVADSVEQVVLNFSWSIGGQSASAVERSRFLGAGLTVLPAASIIGVGSGQYGVVADPILRDIKQDPGAYLILNNVYLEVWLEHGFLALVALLILFGMVLWQTLVPLWYNKNWIEEENLSRLIIGLSLVAYLIQWITFSPVYIMPIFILLGLAGRLGLPAKD